MPAPLLAGESSRWRLAYGSSATNASTTVFNFALSVAPQDSCWPVSYREGNCCNGTLTAITLSMLDAAKGAVTSARLIDSASGAALRGVADPNVG